MMVTTRRVLAATMVLAEIAVVVMIFDDGGEDDGDRGGGDDGGADGGAGGGAGAGGAIVGNAQATPRAGRPGYP